jgi:hypothetical protein
MSNGDDTVTHPNSGEEMTAPEDRDAQDQYHPIDTPDYTPPPDYGGYYYPSDTGPETQDYDTFVNGTRDIEVYTRWVLAIDRDAIERHATHWRRVSQMLADARAQLEERRSALAEAWGGDAAAVFLDHIDNTKRSAEDWTAGAANNASLLDGVVEQVDFAKEYMPIFATHYYNMVNEWQNRDTDKMLVNNPSSPGWTVDEAVLAPGDDQFRAPLPTTTGMVPPLIGGNTTLISGSKAAGEARIRELYQPHGANIVNLLAGEYVQDHYYVDQPPRFRGPTELTPQVQEGPIRQDNTSYLPAPRSGGVTAPPTYPPPGFGGFDPAVVNPPPTGGGGDLAGLPPIGTAPPVMPPGPVLPPPGGPAPPIGTLPPPMMPPGTLPPGGALPPPRPPVPPGGFRPPIPPAAPPRPGPVPLGGLRPPAAPLPPGGGRPPVALSGARPPAPLAGARPPVPPGGLRPGAVPPGGLRPGAVPPGGLRPGAVPPGGLRPGAVPPGGARPGAVPPGVRPGAVPGGAVPPAGARSGPAPLGAARPGPVPLGAARPGAVPRPGLAGPGGVPRPTQGGPTLPGATTQTRPPNPRAAVLAAAGRGAPQPGVAQSPGAPATQRPGGPGSRTSTPAGMQPRLGRPGQPSVTAQRGSPTLSGTVGAAAASRGTGPGSGGRRPAAGRQLPGGGDEERRRGPAAATAEPDDPDRDPFEVPRASGVVESTEPAPPAPHGKPIEPAG